MNSTRKSRYLASCLTSTGALFLALLASKRLIGALFLVLLASKVSSAFGACAEATGPTPPVALLDIYPGGTAGPKFVRITNPSGAPTIQGNDCDADGVHETFIQSTPTNFDVRPLCPGRGVTFVEVEFEAVTSTWWRALDPSGVPMTPPMVFPPGLHVVVFNAPGKCVGTILLQGLFGDEAGGKEICIRRLCYRCKPRIKIVFPLATAILSSSPSLASWNTSESTVTADVVLDSDFQDFNVESAALESTGEGARGWSLSVEATGNFEPVSATVEGTAAASALTDGFQISEIVDPDRNGGRKGVVSVVALPFTEQVSLPPVGEAIVLKITGTMDPTDTEGPESLPRPGTLLPLGQDDLPLLGSASPITSAVTYRGNTESVHTEGAEIHLTALPESVEFVRGDADDDGKVDFSDGLHILKVLFLGIGEITCMDAADPNVDLSVDLSDTLRLFKWLFLGTTANPEAPYPDCGTNPFDESLGCDSFQSCEA